MDSCNRVVVPINIPSFRWIAADLRVDLVKERGAEP